jgi:hypothetical protein
MRVSLLVFAFLTAFLTAFLMANTAMAQNKVPPTEADFAKMPLWIGMMDDTLANFFVVERAFDTYFKHHELPEGENEEIGERRERLKRVSKRKQRRITRENTLRMDVKRYYFWHQQTLPYVQGDGRVLTPTERLAIWQRQQETH